MYGKIPVYTLKEAIFQLYKSFNIEFYWPLLKYMF